MDGITVCYLSTSSYEDGTKMKMPFEILPFTKFSLEKTDCKTASLNQLALKRHTKKTLFNDVKNPAQKYVLVRRVVSRD